LLNTFKNTKDIQSRLTSGYKPLYILILLLIISIGSSKAQNLVYNGDFEIYDSCITNISTPGDLQIERCAGWTAPTKLGTSDYFNICNNSLNGFAGVPNNQIGYQQPFNGNGYCGLVAFDITFNVDYREYIQTKLLQPLVSGNKYKLSFYVVTPFIGYTVEKIGALFSVNNYTGNNFSPIVANPQIVNQNGFLTDTLNWTKIEGEFIADGNEEYLTIGYFTDSLNLDTLNTSPDSILVAPLSYYYVDGIELTVVESEVIIPNIITPNGDGTNDLFQLNFPVLRTEIYNRWGQQLFKSENDAFWDGRTTAGNEAPDGTYYYLITTKEETFKGFVQVIRGNSINYK